jgi:uncharacterized protein with HEPN domain
MPRDARVYLEDILTAIARIKEYTRAMDYPAFLRDVRTIDAVARNLEVIGEASKQTFVSVLPRSNGGRWRECET